MPSAQDDRSAKLIEAYFELPKNRYAEIVQEIKTSGGLSPSEAKAIEDKLVYVHSSTILRHTGTGKKHEAQKLSSH
ncbi:MAG TPA: hypothetical protein VEZ90_14920 [Blastocatellia bacterium]|nr:hypothetical protein [Blastocatellia bacterium]